MKTPFQKIVSVLLTLVIMISVFSTTAFSVDKSDYNSDFIASNIAKVKDHIKQYGTYDSVDNVYRERYPFTYSNQDYILGFIYYPETDIVEFLCTTTIIRTIFLVALYFKDFDSTAYINYGIVGSGQNLDAHSADFYTYTYTLDDATAPEIIVDSNLNNRDESEAKEMLLIIQKIAFMIWSYFISNFIGLPIFSLGFGGLCDEHVFKELKTEDSTCTQTGYESTMCKYCGLINTKEIPVKNHNPINRNGVCEKCGQTVIDVSKCSCSCHKDDFFSKVITGFKMIFWKLFRTNQICSCGTQHY